MAGGQVALYDPASGDWLSDFGANTLVRFNSETEEFSSFALPSTPADACQILGRPGEVWGAESAAEKLVVVRT